jgi:EAL domain-containing protein (putative c-di-GMP-specific phosphodiesterase class I)
VREAIDADRLLLHHQPIFDLANGAPAADEILVRMLEPDGSVLPPGAFLPTAERFGLIREIDRWVIAQAIEAAAPFGPITINVSARSISDPNLHHHIAAALERSGADPANVVFEITETAAATASDELRGFGARIERLGCALAIDDFGTGFGSLTYLKHLPVRYLKIDMEFVRGIAESAADRAIVQSIVTIAGSLGMQTIGEGVEDQPTLECLTALGVDFAQGYHLGRPVALGA